MYTLYLFTGTADEKLELIFRMYDVNNDQTLDKKEFKNMLKSMMDLVRADVPSNKLDQVNRGVKHCKQIVNNKYSYLRLFQYDSSDLI